MAAQKVFEIEKTSKGPIKVFCSRCGKLVLEVQTTQKIPTYVECTNCNVVYTRHLVLHQNGFGS